MLSRALRFIKKYDWLLTAFFLCIGAGIVARGTNDWIALQLNQLGPSEAFIASSTAGGAASTAPVVQLRAIAERNLLGLKRESLQPVAIAPEPEDALGDEFNEGELQACTLPISVRATLVSSNAPSWSLAVVYNNSTRETNAYGTWEGGNQLLADAALVEIRSGEIIVRRREHFERCYAEPQKAQTGSRAAVVVAPPASSPAVSTEGGGGAGVRKISGTEYHVERKELDRVLSNLSSVATKARIVPSFKNGKPNGFKFFSIRAGSIYAKIGLKNGDVVQRVNGYPLDSPEKALELYQKLKSTTRVTVDLERRGKPLSMRYSIGR